MAAMTWKKSPEGLVKRFEEVVPNDPLVERRSMFGYPCAFLGGNMFCGLFQDQFILRLPDRERGRFLEQKGAAVFEPMPGRPMKEYVVVPPKVREDDSALGRWIGISRDYVASLPAKAKKTKSAAKKIAKMPAAKTAKRG